MSYLELFYFDEDNSINYYVGIEYLYIHRPAILRADPNDSCGDESELKIEIKDIFPTPTKNSLLLIKKFIESDEVANKCIEDYNNAIC